MILPGPLRPSAATAALACLHAGCTPYVADCGPDAAPCLLDLRCCPRVFNADQHGPALTIAPVRAGSEGVHVMTETWLFTVAGDQEPADPAEPLAHFEGPETSARLSISPSSVYVASRDRRAVFRVELGGDTQSLAGAERCPGSIAAAEALGRVLWVATCLDDSPEPAPVLRRHDLGPAVTMSMEDTTGVADVAHDGTSAYWSIPAAHTIVRASSDGYSRSELLSADQFFSPSLLAVDSQNVYFESDGSVLKIGRESLMGVAWPVASAQGTLTHLVADSPDLLAWATADGGDGGLGQIVASDAQGETLVVASARVGLGGVAISGGGIYWVDGGSVYRFEK